MRARGLCCAAFALLACVPGTQEDTPRGAAGFDILPSPGPPAHSFTTGDGYEVTVERLILVVQLDIGPAGLDYYGASGYVVSATEPAQVFARGLSEGFRDVTLRFSRADEGATKDIEGWDRISPEEQARLQRVADAPATDGALPSMLLRLRATRGPMRVRLDVALGTSSSSRGPLPTATLDVQRNALRSRSVEARVPGLFADSRGATSFQSFANADLDGDGVIDPRELARGRVSNAEARDAGLTAFNANTSALLLARMRTSLFVLRR